MTITKLEILVEEFSAEEALKNLLPKILPSNIRFEIHTFQGKQDLLKKLPQRLKGYQSWLPNDWRIIVLCDRDNDDCQDLRKRLEDHAYQNRDIVKSGVCDKIRQPPD